MREYRFALALALAIIGCGSTDPCANQSGACISARVIGSASGLDQLALTIDRPSVETVRTPDPAAAFSLPVRVGLLLPAGTTGPVTVSIDGISNGQIVASTSIDVTVPPSGHVSQTFVLDAGTAGADFAIGSDLGDGAVLGADMSCANATTCVAGDGCCPIGCSTATDSDCKPAVCGNGVVENGEACDDGNLVNGDNCDPTCHYVDALSTVSGKPEGVAHNDGTGVDVRFGGIASISSDFSNLYVTETGTRAIRTVTLAGAVSTLAGFTPNNPATPLDGNFGSATFRNPAATVYYNNSLYLIDDTLVRQIDLVGKSVNTLFTLGANAYAQDSLGVDPDAGSILIVGTNVLSAFTPPSTTLTAIAGAANAPTVGGGACSRVAYFKDAASVKHYYLTCGKTVVDVSGGNATLFAGSTTQAGCADGDVTTATFTVPLGIAIQPNGTTPLLFVGDQGCHDIRKIVLAGTGAGTVTQYAACTNASGCGDAQTTASNMAHLSGPTELFFDPINTTLYTPDNGLLALPVAGGVSVLAGLWRGRYLGPPQFGSSGNTSLYGIITALVSDGTNVYATDAFTGSVFTVSLMNGGSQTLPNSTFGALQGVSGNTITRIGATLYVGLDDGTIRSIGTDGSNPVIYAGTPRAAGSAASPVDGPRLSAVISPAFLTTDEKDLFFLDDSKVLRKIDQTSGMISTLAGTTGSTDVVDGTGQAAHFASPIGLACDGASLYTLDGSGAIPGTVVRSIKIGTSAVALVAGDPTLAGSVDGVGAAARFAGATGITTDGQVLFVADAGPGYRTIDRNGPVIREVDLKSGATSTQVGAYGHWSSKSGIGKSALVDAPGPMTFDPATHGVIFFDAVEHTFQRIH